MAKIGKHFGHFCNTYTVVAIAKIESQKPIFSYELFFYYPFYSGFKGESRQKILLLRLFIKDWSWSGSAILAPMFRNWQTRCNIELFSCMQFITEHISCFKAINGFFWLLWQHSLSFKSPWENNFLQLIKVYCLRGKKQSFLTLKSLSGGQGIFFAT